METLKKLIEELEKIETETMVSRRGNQYNTKEINKEMFNKLRKYKKFCYQDFEVNKQTIYSIYIPYNSKEKYCFYLKVKD